MWVYGFERESEHSFDDDLVREPDTQRESSARGGLRGERLLRHRDRVARERRHDRGADLEPLRRARAERGTEDRVHAEDVREPATREAVGLGGLGLRD